MRRRVLKKILSGITAAALALTYIALPADIIGTAPLAVFAEEEGYEPEPPAADPEPEEVFTGWVYGREISFEEYISEPFYEDEDLTNDQWFMMYLQGGYDFSYTSDYGSTHLSGKNYNAYTALKPKIKAIAKGTDTSGSTQFTLPISTVHTKTEFTVGTSSECDIKLDVSNINDANLRSAVDSILSLDTGMINGFLRADCPADMYWHDKTISTGYSFSGGSYTGYQEGGKITKIVLPTEGSYVFKYPVAKDYCPSSYTWNTASPCYTVDSDKISSAVTALNNAQAIVSAAKTGGKSAYERMVDYKAAICSRVVYDYDAIKPTYSDGINPWQLVNVFDGNTSTNVVCEGYSKAFQYLCDLDGGIECYTVSGTMSGGTGAGGHMWNVVRLDGKSYLVDITNCDGPNSENSYSSGYPDKLFLVGAVQDSSNINKYTVTIPARQVPIDTYGGNDVLTSGTLGGGTIVYTYYTGEANTDNMRAMYGDVLNLSDTDYGASTTKPLTDAMVAAIADQVYTGSAIQPTVTVNDGGTTLTENTDYTVSYGTNTNVGTGTVIVTGKGNYSGEVTKTFTITAAAATYTAPTAKTLTYNGSEQELVSAGSAVGGSVKYSTSESGTYSASIPKGTNAGSYEVWWKVEADGNHTGKDPAKIDVSIGQKAVTSPVIELEYNTHVYTNENLTPTVTVKDGTTVIPSTEYEVAYDNNKNVGTAKVTVSNVAGGNYTITEKTVNFTITKATPTVTGVSKSAPDNVYTTTALADIELTSTGTPGSIALDAGQTLTEGTKNYNWTFTPTDEANYNTATGTISITVEAKTLSSIAVTGPTKKSYTYGDSLDKAGMVVTATFTDTSTADVTSDVTIDPAVLTPGVTTLTVSYGGKTATISGITVAKKDITVTAKNQTITYGDSIATGKTQVTVTGLVSGDELDSIVLEASGAVITPKTAVIKKGSTVVTDNYNITYDNGTLAESKKPITITANNQTIDYGGDITKTTAQVTVTGLVSGDTLESIDFNVSGTTITPKDAEIKKGSDVVTSKYNITYNTGTLTVNKKALTITGATLAEKTYDGTNRGTVTGVTFDGLIGSETLTLGTDFTAAVVYDSADAGTGRTATVTVNLLNTTKANNYTISTAALTLTGQAISQAGAITIADKKISRIMTTTTGTVPVTGFMPSDAGTLTYTAGTATTTNAESTVSCTVSATGTVTYNITDGAKDDVITLPITIKSTNYADSTVKVIITLTDKESQHAPPAFSLSFTEDGEKFIAEIPAVDGAEYSFDGGTTWSETNNTLSNVNPGTVVTGTYRMKETSDKNASDPVSSTRKAPLLQVKTPVITPAGGVQTFPVTVTITCATSDAKIYYTTDGSAPTVASTLYTGEFTVSSAATVKAIGAADGKSDSEIASAVYSAPAPAHVHTYSTAWSSDDTYHWHAASCGHDTLVSDKAEHTWDSGKITKPAAAKEDGVKTYTCTVCGKTKTETIPASGETEKPAETTPSGPSGPTGPTGPIGPAYYGPTVPSFVQQNIASGGTNTKSVVTTVSDVRKSTRSSITFDAKNDSVSASVLKAFAANKRAKTFTAKTDKFKLKIEKTNITDKNALSGIDLSLSSKPVVTQNQIRKSVSLKDSKAIIQLNFTGSTPKGIGKFTLQVKSVRAYRGKIAYIYEVKDGKLRKTAVVKVGSDGYVSFSTDHLGKYVVSIK